MRNKTRLMAAGMACVLAFSLAGCDFRETATNILIKVLGVEDSDEDESSTDIYAPAGGSVTFPEGFDSTSRWTTQIQDGNLYIGFNGIQNKNTGYFSPAGTSVTISSYASTESTGLTEYKAALWALSADATSTQYVPDSTIYYTTSADGTCYTYTIEGLDPGTKYKVVVSFDAGSAYISGGMQVTGIAGDALEEVAGESGSTSGSN